MACETPLISWQIPSNVRKWDMSKMSWAGYGLIALLNQFHSIPRTPMHKYRWTYIQGPRCGSDFSRRKSQRKYNRYLISWPLILTLLVLHLSRVLMWHQMQSQSSKSSFQKHHSGLVASQNCTSWHLGCQMWRGAHWWCLWHRILSCRPSSWAHMRHSAWQERRRDEV